MWYESLTPETGRGDSRMKKRSKRDTPEQIVKKLRDADVMLSGQKHQRDCKGPGAQRSHVPPLAEIVRRHEKRGGQELEIS